MGHPPQVPPRRIGGREQGTAVNTRNSTMTEHSSAAHAAAHGIVCPSCGRFVGAFDRCPYCGTGVAKRIPLRVVRLGALGVALSGMVCLHLMAVHRETPTIGIADITPAMNYAFRSVVGRAARPLTYHRLPLPHVRRGAADSYTINGSPAAARAQGSAAPAARGGRE